MFYGNVSGDELSTLPLVYSLPFKEHEIVLHACMNARSPCKTVSLDVYLFSNP